MYVFLLSFFLNNLFCYLHTRKFFYYAVVALFFYYAFGPNFKKSKIQKIEKSVQNRSKSVRFWWNLVRFFRNLISHNLVIVPGAKHPKNEEKQRKQNPKKIKKKNKNSKNSWCPPKLIFLKQTIRNYFLCFSSFWGCFAPGTMTRLWEIKFLKNLTKFHQNRTDFDLF